MPTRAAWPKNSKLSAKTKRKKMLQLSLKENRNKNNYLHITKTRGYVMATRTTWSKKTKLPAAGIN